MNQRTILLTATLLILFLIPTFGEETTPDSVKAPRIIEIEDADAWMTIRSAQISNDGKWMGYQLSPNKGDREIVIKEIDGEKEYKFPVGQAPSYGNTLIFSDDSKWVAFTKSPTEKENKKGKKSKKKLYNQAVLVELASGEKNEFDKVRRYQFSGESAQWLALHKYQPEDGGKDKPKGADLILRELATGSEFNIGNVSEYAFDKKGRWLAWLIDARDRSGNGIQLRILEKNIVLVLDSDSAVYKQLNWTEEGEALAVLKGKDDKKYKEPLYSLVGFKEFQAKTPVKVVFNPADEANFPEKMTISPNRAPLWTDDLEGILFGIHAVEEKEDQAKDAAKDSTAKTDSTAKADSTQTESKDKDKEVEKKKEAKKKGANKKEDEELPELVIWHAKDKRLQSMQQKQEGRDKNFSYLSIYRPDTKQFFRLADDSVRQVNPAPKHMWAMGYNNLPYLWQSNLDGRRYEDIYAINLKTGERKLALKKCRWDFDASPDGTHFLYYDDGHYYTWEMATGKTYNITQDVPTTFIDTESDINVVKPPVRPVGWVKDGKGVLLSDDWDVWHVPVHGGKGKNLSGNGRREKIRYQRRFRLDPEEKGIDLSQPVYFSTYGEWTKKGGIARIDNGTSGAKSLLWGDARFYNLFKAKNAGVYLYTKETHTDYPDYYMADGALQNGKRLTEANPKQKEFLWSAGTRLINYVSTNGDTLQAALYLPANYEAGQTYPTIVYIYEKLSQRLNNYPIPRVYGFDTAMYTSWGYAVLMPDIVYKVNDPGLSAVACVLPAMDAAIATGIVDAENVAVHGHSWGGYQTAFLITQTNKFKAAVAGAPLTDLISMYSSIYWNTGSANQPIFESSQGRFTDGYWEIPEAYTRNSPVYYAQNVTTPLLLLHNDKDGAVDWNQGIEYYNTLRRLNKSVIMLQYKGENHGLAKPENREDYTYRMRDFFEHHLKGKPATTWLKEGVAHLKMEEHLKERGKKD